MLMSMTLRGIVGLYPERVCFGPGLHSVIKKKNAYIKKLV